MKKMKKLLAVVLVALTFTCAMPVKACTPPLNPPKINIPEIDVKLDDNLQAGIDAAVKKFLEKNVLEKPAVKYASYIKRTSRYGTYGCLSVQWGEVDNATHYEVMVAKADGTKKTYTTSYNTFVRANYFDEFLADGMDGATIRVKAYGEDETFSLWSDGVVVATYNF